MRLPHPLDRRYQKEAYQRIADSSARYVICRLATGIGKTAIAANLACNGYRTMACVMTKSLQWQYVEPYQFVELFGKGNYVCGCSLKNRGKPYNGNDDPFTDVLTSDVCEPAGKYKSSCRSSCDYYVARDRMISGDGAIINYHKFLSDRGVVNSVKTDSGKVIVQGYDPDILVFDEAHELSDMVVNHSGFTLNWSYKKMMRFCKPIMIKPDDNLPAPLAKKQIVSEAIKWCNDLLDSLELNIPRHPSRGGDIKEWKWHKNRIDEVDTVIGCLEIEPHCWYIHTDEVGITIKPKTAKYHFKPLFEKAPKIVMMSATISPTDVESLGITDYEFINIPNPIPAPMRPINDLQGPPITAKSTLADKKRHAQIIASVFQDSPDHWNGLVHFPSKKDSEDWGEWLYQMTRRPVYVPERGVPTDEAYQRWLEFEQNNTGAICVAWNMMTGIDGKNININITGRTPYPNFGDAFERERFNYSPKEARRRVGNLIEQQQGRNRRGFSNHYGPQAEKFNGIADGKWVRLKSAMQKDFLEAIVG